VAFLLESDLELLAEMRLTLLVARGLSEVPAAPAVEGTHRRKPTSKRPPHSSCLADEIAERYSVTLAIVKTSVDRCKYRTPARFDGSFKEWARFVSSRYEGKSAREAAVIEGCSQSLIEKARRVAKQNGRVAA
jgi:hypothetical protein